MSTLMHSEIFDQPKALKHAYEVNISKIKEIAKEAKEKGITHVVTTARGSSDNACVYFKYLCETYVGWPVSSAAPSVSTIYGSKLSYANCLVVGVSQSGAGIDVCRIVEDANEQGALTVGVTNFPESRLGKGAKVALIMECGEEKSVAATKTFTCQMYLLAWIVAEIADNDALRAALMKAPEAIEAALNKENEIDALAVKMKGMNDCYILSRGFALVASVESALKLSETNYVKSKAYPISDFYHGPFAVVDETQNVFVLAGKGMMDEDHRKMIDRLKEAGANVIIVTNDVELGGLNLPTCDEVVFPFEAVATMQLFAERLAAAKGNNPDCPRGLKKVTITK
ncbi:MAG: SIS domain-containing protein [Bacilli bacterium]|nr:SIS domain-containing protein [Bacilli bacterium]